MLFLGWAREHLSAKEMAAYSLAKIVDRAKCEKDHRQYGDGLE
jgi:hypothetical protein